MMKYCYYNSPIGELLISGANGAITGLWIVGQKYFADTLEQSAGEDADDQTLRKARTWLDQYFAGRKPEIGALSLAPKGSGFRQKVWDILCGIPYGEVVTYGDIAKRIAAAEGKKTMSAQAVGGAVGHNPISIIIPCHRVIGADGSLTGYAGGVQKKKWLLEFEKVFDSRGNP